MRDYHLKVFLILGFERFFDFDLFLPHAHLKATAIILAQDILKEAR
jgi:hypothetical protein